MIKSILTVEIRFEQDVVKTRQRARQIAELLGFDSQDQTRIATAVSEIARNAFQYAHGGKAEFRVEEDALPMLLIYIRDTGPGIRDIKEILEGHYTSKTGMGLGIIGSKRLMDKFYIESVPKQGTTVVMGKVLPKRSPPLTAQRLTAIVDELVRQSPRTPLEEIQQQNQEILSTLAELEKRNEQLSQLNQEMEDTNRGVVALYAELDEKAHSLQRANELKTRFLSNMSHEFRTPLNSIISLSRMLLDRLDGDLTTEQEKQVTFIYKSAESLSELVNDLLDLAKVEAGKLTVYPKEFEVSELFGALRGMLRPLLTPNSLVSLVFEEPVGLPMLCTDEGKVGQILRNFISNALKYTEKGEVRVSAMRKAENVIFSVADTGIGIAPEDRERIFEEFVQVDSHIQKRVKGTGLGLPLSQKLAELLGGRISVSSTLGIGSTFCAVIPLRYGTSTEATLGVSPWELNLIHSDPTLVGARTALEGDVQQKVLIIDDEEISRYLLKELLNRHNFTIVEATSGQEGLRKVEEEHPAAIFLDLVMPEMDGWQVLAQLKGNAATSRIPIIINTSKVLEEEERRYLAEWTVGILSKESSSRTVALAELREALIKAKLVEQP